MEAAVKVLEMEVEEPNSSGTGEEDIPHTKFRL